MDIGLTVFDEVSPLTFYIGNEKIKEIFTFNINNGVFSISHKSGSLLNICIGRRRAVSLDNFLNENPPRIWFVDGSSLEGNYVVKLKKSLPISFPSNQIDSWDWNGVDITKESQTKNKLKDSIQYRVIDRLKESGKYAIIFDDDGSGEIADVVAIQEDDDSENIYFELYHCKYSHKKCAGSRVSDLYEVCGQADKCIKWVDDANGLIKRLLDREKLRKASSEVSKFELGNAEILFRIRKKLKYYTTEFSVYIVQPGVDRENITSDMHQVLCCSQMYLQDTCSIQLRLICS